MKITRGVKSNYRKFLTKKKQKQLDLIMEEYSRIVNAYIGRFQKMVPRESKMELLKAKNIHTIKSWLSNRMMKSAMLEAYGMIKSAKSNAKKRKQNYIRPRHRGKNMLLSENNITININPKIKKFDLIITLKSIGKKGTKIKINILLKRHINFNNYNEWKLAKSIIIHKDTIQFTFTKNIKKKDSGKAIGIDFGINKFMATSKRETFGEGYKELLIKLLRKKAYSKAWYRCKEEIKEHIDKTIKEFPFYKYGLIVVEKLDKVHHKMKLKRSLSKNMRRLVSKWTYRYIYDKLFMECNKNCVRYLQVPSYRNSITCPQCNHTNKKNRQSQEFFSCQKCGFSDNADYTSANIALRRGLTGAYGPSLKNFTPVYSYGVV